MLIKDKNRHSFTVDDVPERDTDVFYTNFVVKLRKLRDLGAIEKLVELRNHRNNVVCIDIVGGIDLDKI